LAAKLFSSHSWRLKHGKLLSTLGGGLQGRQPWPPKPPPPAPKSFMGFPVISDRQFAEPPHIETTGKCALCGRNSSFVLRNRFQADLPVCGGCVITEAPPTADRIVTVRRSREQQHRRPFGSTTSGDVEVSMFQPAPPWED
jgi:hypothetical protein